MADVLRIKRRAVGGAAGAPASLAAAEIAFNEQDNTLWYGKGNSGDIATSIISIGGSGAYLPLTGGTLSGALIVNNNTTSQIHRATGSTASVQFDNRATSIVDWTMYATGGSCFLFNGTNKFTLTSTGALTVAAGLTATIGTFSGAVTITGSLGVGGAARSGNMIDAPGGQIAGLNYVIDDQTSAKIGVVGFNNTSGPSIVFYGSTSTGAGTMLFRFNNTGVCSVNTATSFIPAVNNSINCGVPGAAWNGVYAYSYPNQSDAILKTAIEPVSLTLASVRALQPKTFQWRDGPDTERRHHGFIASDVRDVLGEGFGGWYRDAATGLQSVDYNELTSVLWRAVQELADEVERLKAR